MPKSDDDSHHVSVSTHTSPAPSAPSIPTSSIDTESASHFLEPLVFEPGPSSTESSPTMVRPEENLVNMGSLEFDMMSLGAQNYVPMQNFPTMPMTGIETYPSGDELSLPWIEPTQEDNLASAEIPWQGAAMPLSLPPPSLGGWELGVRGYDETPLTPTSLDSITEPIKPDKQISPPSVTHQEAAGRCGCDGCPWPHLQKQEPCQCLQRAVSSLEEIDTEAVDTNSRELGSWLSKHKEALRCSEALLVCLHCRAKPENMTTLALLTNRLITMCDNVVSSYLSTLAGDLNYEALASQDAAWLVRELLRSTRCKNGAPL